MTTDAFVAGTSSVPPSYRHRFIWGVCLVAALGGLLFGYDWVVISGADIFYEKFFGLTSASEIGWTKSCALIGCLVGSVISGWLSDRFGRRRLLLLAALLFGLSALGTALTSTYILFITWRILGGTAIGLASNLSPVYIAELAPAHLRGRLVAVNQLTIVIGIVLAQLVNWLIAEPVAAGATAADILQSWNGQSGWRWMFGVMAVPSLLFFLGMMFVPESPRWLTRNGNRHQAEVILSRIGGKDYARTSMLEMEATLSTETTTITLRELFEPRTRKLLLFGAAFAFIQQWCGINVIFYYAKDVFAAAGYQVSDILLNIVVIGLANFSFTFLAILTVDRWGRRPLVLAGWIGLVVIFLAMAGAYAMNIKGLPIVILVVLAISHYACTLAPVTWVVLSEIFPNRIRGTAMAIAVFSLWLGNFLLTYTFPLLSARLGAAGTFLLYAVICAIGYTYVRSRLPETKGKTLERIEEEFAG